MTTSPRGKAAGRPGFLGRPIALPPAPEPREAPGLLRVEALTLTVPGPTGPIAVVRDVGFSLAPGETLAIVGESGSGKTLTGLAVMGLLPAACSARAAPSPRGVAPRRCRPPNPCPAPARAASPASARPNCHEEEAGERPMMNPKGRVAMVSGAAR